MKTQLIDITIAIFGLFLFALFLAAAGRKILWILSNIHRDALAWLQIQWVRPKVRRMTEQLPKTDLDSFATGLVMSGYELGDGLTGQGATSNKDNEMGSRIRRLVVEGLESRSYNEVLEIIDVWIQESDPVLLRKALGATRR